MSKKSKGLMSKLFNNQKPESTKVDLKQPDPRSADEINKEYQNVCIQIGDKTVKAEGLKQELDQLFKYVQSLGNELAARQKLEEAQKQPAATASPITTDTLAQSNEVPA